LYSSLFICFKVKEKKCFCVVDGEIKVFAKAGLKKRDDKKGHVFELQFSDELYN
jgi:hypothetical protein